jgi:hypothetical protein
MTGGAAERAAGSTARRMAARAADNATSAGPASLTAARAR